MKTYIQTVATPDICPKCGSDSVPLTNPILEIRDRHTHEVLRRLCDECFRKEPA